MNLNYLLPGLEDFVMETNNVHIENNINIPTEDEKRIYFNMLADPPKLIELKRK